MKYYMANIAVSGSNTLKTVIAKVENDVITDIIWDPEKRLESWRTDRYMKSLAYDANRIIMNIFEWAAKGTLRV